MNKRQRKKQEKKLRLSIDKTIEVYNGIKAKVNSGKIEVGDTVEIIKNNSSLGGHDVGTIGVVSEIDKGINSFVRVVKNDVRLWSFLESVRLVKKGTDK